MSSSTNRKSSVQRSAVYYHCGLRAIVCNTNIPKNKGENSLGVRSSKSLRAIVCNMNTPKNKGRKFFGCSKFKE
ncbi:hypothetical protein J1N35_011775, partial [Gossypium stocksii]